MPKEGRAGENTQSGRSTLCPHAPLFPLLVEDPS